MAAPAAAKRPYSQVPAAAAAEPNKWHRTAAAAAAPALMDAKPEPEPEQQDQPLLPGLPDHLAHLCLAPLPPRLMHAVCRPWRRLLYSPSFPPFLSLYAVLDDASTGPASGTGGLSFAAYDAVAGRWDDLPAPPMPSSPPRLWHPSFLSRRLPLQSVAAGGRLVLVAGSTQSLAPALPRPVVFDPGARAWRLGPRFPFAPRRWCAAGAARGRVFLAGGVGAGYDASDARSGATWDPASATAAAGWEPIRPMRDARFSRDAAEAVCAAGKVCMVSLRGRGAKEGAVFDLRAATWEDMPPGMLAGWKGPAAAVDETTIFVVDEERGALSEYDWAGDRWRTVVESERFKGAAEMAAGGGRVCVAAQGGEKVVVVDVAPCRPSPQPPSRRWGAPAAAPRPRVWEVAAPPGKRVVSLHVLPRMARAE
ncbi:F-box/kelch-repeat protein SKIP25-like [Miscanthus floridulus]|uniref:F-box/kelch-repeat protein SKIP25-like n=1 Tax=Miscanthus floridulus TaxID=154761 RepID=UPI00345944EF